MPTELTRTAGIARLNVAQFFLPRDNRCSPAGQFGLTPPDFPQTAPMLLGTNRLRRARLTLHWRRLIWPPDLQQHKQCAAIKHTWTADRDTLPTVSRHFPTQNGCQTITPAVLICGTYVVVMRCLSAHCPRRNVRDIAALAHSLRHCVDRSQQTAPTGRVSTHTKHRRRSDG